MQMFRKLVLTTLAAAALVLPSLEASQQARAVENSAPESAAAPRWVVECYGVYFDQASAQGVVNSINGGNASGWRGAYIGTRSYWRTTPQGVVIYRYPVYAQHYTN